MNNNALLINAKMTFRFLAVVGSDVDLFPPFTLFTHRTEKKSGIVLQDRLLLVFILQGLVLIPQSCPSF